jgi:hypothetical protein
MDMPDTTIVLCTCEDTMQPDGGAVAKACKGATIKGANHLCRSEAGVFVELAAKTGRLVIGCTQEAPLFQDLADDSSSQATLSFVNIRETAGWSTEGKNAGAKMAALIAAASVDPPPVPAVTLTSEGVALILGRGQEAVDAAAKLAGRLDVTVILTSTDGVIPPGKAEFPIRQGRARSATGWLGAFEVVIDRYAEPAVGVEGMYHVGPATHWPDVEVRHRDRPYRRSAAVSCLRPSLWISARRS